MSRSGFMLIGLVAAAALYLGFSAHTLRSSLEKTEAALGASLTQQRTLAGSLSTCEADRARSAPVPAAALDPAVCDCPEAPACPEPVQAIMAPDGTLLATPEERDAYVRAHLEARIADAYSDDVMDARKRSDAVALLGRIRALRSEQGGHGATAGTPAERRDAIADAENAFIDLTGMGVGEFLESITARAPARKLGTKEAAPIEEGPVMKRFADETARMLGITEPGSVEPLGKNE